MSVRESNRPVQAVPPRTGRVFAIVALAVGMANLDLFVVNVALPVIGRDFHGAPLSSLSWVLNGYAIVFAALLVPLGRIADRIGHRTGFLLGLGTFTLASALCALCPSVGWLIAARVLQAAGAALCVPTSLALLLAAAAPERRAPLVRAWVAVGGVAAALGPVLGGLLTQIDWRWVFLINVPIGVAGLVLGPRVLPRNDARADKPWPDMLGSALMIFAVGALALALVKADDWGWGSVRFGGTVAVAVLAAALFVWRSAVHPAPVLDMSLLRVRGFGVATVAATLFTVAFAMMLLSVVLWCQQVLGYSAVQTGLAVAPGPLMVPLLSLMVSGLARRMGGANRVAALGTALFAGGIAWWAASVDPSVPASYPSQILPGMVLTGIGVGLTLPALIGSAAAALPATQFATGSAVIQMGRQVGSVLGISLLVTVLGGRSGQDPVEMFRSGWLVLLGVCAVALVAAAWPAKRPTA
ncbi:MFS transporter [Longispora fulva]|uniref:EmrB/QacA subfamily drug resistance transporter n=1 Tax=Longispora fulva TaxID=619741 RepID=A0A8J7KPU5_9ACTN|nr:MFS transporter [Longispora fulva]MBG6136707.1 EmrB/QacA subfamily drug resistance transporter [Longispora fulva]